jgi:excisionase family DNA binding protein
MEQDLLTTTEAARRLKVGTSTLKRWADLGKIKSFRTPGGHRRFARTEIEQYVADREEIDHSRWIDLLLLDEGDPLLVTAELLRERARLGSWWRVVTEVGQLLEEMGRRWVEGTMSVLQEHVASEQLRRALLWCSQSMLVPQGAPTCLLAGAAGDDHTLGLSLVELCCREAGWRTRWAGRRAPTGDLVGWIEEGQVQLLALSASVASSDARVLEAQYRALALAAQAAGVELVLGGSGAWPEVLHHGRRMDDFGELHTYLIGLKRDMNTA